MELLRQEFIDCITTHKVAVLHRTKGRIETRMQIDDHTFASEISELKESDFERCIQRSGGLCILGQHYCFLYYPLAYTINFSRFGNVLVAEEVFKCNNGVEYHYDIFVIQ